MENSKTNEENKGGDILGTMTKPKYDEDGYPDLSNHNNLMAQVLTKDMWLKLKDIKSDMGYTFDEAIRTGVYNPGHPHIMTCGCTAGDESSFTVFREFFDKVIELRHNGFVPGQSKHSTSLDPESIKNGEFDEDYVLTARVRTGRSIRGFALPPHISKDDRETLEKKLSESFAKLDGDLKGQYKGLYDMTDEEQEGYIAEHIMFDKPVSPLLIASKMDRDWPTGRGMFWTDKKDFIIWVNEEDHIRVISMQKGGNMKEVYSRFCRGLSAVEDALKEAGCEYQHSDELGYILTCPSNIGTGIRAGVHVKLPNLQKHELYKKFLSDNKLQARGAGGVDTTGGDIVDLSNADRLGHTEDELVQLTIDGVHLAVKLEKMLENGESIDGAW